jgi:oligopeptide transport system substrate-binding protein
VQINIEGRRTNLRIFGQIIGVLVIAAMLALTSCDFSRVPSQDSQILNRGLMGEPESLRPHHVRSNQAAAVLRDIGEGLVRYDGAGNIVGGVANNWTISEDGLEYIFDIREDARWSNTDSIYAKDFVRAFRALVTPEFASANANNGEHILNAPEIMSGKASPSDLGVIDIGDRQLKITLHSPAPYFIQLLAHPSMYPMHSSNSLAAGGRNSNDLNITNGAYLLDEWIVGSSLRLRRNKSYWQNEKTSFDQVVYHFLEGNSELTRFRAGELDITENVPSTSFESVRQQYSDELKVAPFLGVYYYGFNLTSSLFRDKPDLRRSLSLAIDRELLVSKVTVRGELGAYGWVPFGFRDYTSQSIEEAALSKADRETLALQLYEGAGFGPKNPLRFEVRYNTSDVEQRIALAIQSMWRDVLGAEVTLVNEEFRVLIANIEEQKITEVFRLSWTGDYNDPQTFLKLFESKNASNLTGYSNPEFDELMAQAGLETSAAKRRILLEDAETLMLADHPAIPLYFYVSKHLVSTRVTGWEDNILDIHASQFLAPRQIAVSEE